MKKQAYLPASDILKAALIGGGVGLGARGLKQVSDLWQERDVKSPVNLPRLPSPNVRLPVRVSPEEAAELERQGLTVRRVKRASDFINNLGMAAVGAGAAYGGWKLLDGPLDEDRKALATAKLKATRRRVEMLLNDQPQHPDLALHGYMKAAEDVYLKTAGFGSDLFMHSLDLFSPLAIPLGLAGVALGAGAYNDAQSANKNEQAIRALKSHYTHQSVSPSRAELEPVVVDEEEPVEDDISMLKAAELGPKVVAALELKRKPVNAVGKALSAGKPFAEAVRAA